MAESFRNVQLLVCVRVLLSRWVLCHRCTEIFRCLLSINNMSCRALHRTEAFSLTQRQSVPIFQMSFSIIWTTESSCVHPDLSVPRSHWRLFVSRKWVLRLILLTFTRSCGLNTLNVQMLEFSQSSEVPWGSLRYILKDKRREREDVGDMFVRHVCNVDSFEHVAMSGIEDERKLCRPN